MAVGQILSGIGCGSVFGHGRIFAVHNPLDSALGKTRDPFINMKRVVSSSNSADPLLKSAAENTLSAKIEHGFNPGILSAVDRSVLIGALSKASVIGEGLKNSRREEFSGTVRRIISGCSIEELGFLSNSGNLMVFSAVQEAAAPLRDEILQTSFARYLAVFTPKRTLEEVLPAFKSTHWNEQVFYVKRDIDQAAGLLSKAQSKYEPGERWTRSQILRQLSHINPQLAELLRGAVPAV